MLLRPGRHGRRLLGGVLLAAAVHVGLALPASGADATVEPEDLVFDTLAPGETSSAVTTLRVDAPSGAAIVRAEVAATGELVPHLTTAVESCATAWTVAGCAPGATLLVEGPAASSGSALRVPVPATGVVHLRVGMTLSDDAPPEASGTVVYRLDLVGDDAGGGGTDGGGTDGGGTDDGAGDGGSGGPPLASTGADVAAVGAAALALVALGAALHRARPRHDREGAV